MTFETWDNFFTQLMFGTGQWIGAICILALILVVCWKIKPAAFLFLPLTWLMGLEYIETVSSTEPFFYVAIIMMALPIFLIVDYLRGK